MSAKPALDQRTIPTAYKRARGNVLAGVDARTRGAKRYNAVLQQLLAEMLRLQDNVPPLPMSKQVLARRAALLSVWCEEAEAKVARGEAVDIVEFNTTTNVLRKLLVQAGLN